MTRIIVMFFGHRTHRPGGEATDIDEQGPIIWGARFQGEQQSQTLRIVPEDPTFSCEYGGVAYECEIVEVTSTIKETVLVVRPIDRIPDTKVREAFA